MYEFVDNHLKTEEPKRPKKITGTRLASVLGLDRWNTPFKTWCAVTRTYEDPFTENIYTNAGKVIEPKIINYMNSSYFLNSVKSPTDIYGKDYFEKTRGDFFKDKEIFGGMWDALVVDTEGKPEAVIEIKTSKRVEDWADGKAPIYYSMQAALYAYLLGVDNVVMVASFLEDDDYEHPENFEPNSSNTIVDDFSLKERFPDFEKCIDLAKEWWYNYVLTGVSPDFDEKKDEEILKVLRTNTISTDSEMLAAMTEAEQLMGEIEEVTKTIADKEARLKDLKNQIKSYGSKFFRDGDKKVSMKTDTFEWSISKSVKTDIDKKALEKDGLLKKYAKTSEVIKLNPPKLLEKEDKSK